LSELTDPVVAEAVAQIRKQLAAGKSCIVLRGPAVAAKPTILKALLSEPAMLSSGRSVKHSVAELDQLHSNLKRSSRFVILLDGCDEVYAGRPDVAMATPSTASPVDTPDQPWASTVGSLPA